MNLNPTLHHFKKEARHLRLRWLLWLALLAFDLALQLEWLMPMDVDDRGDSLASMAHTFTVLGAVILALSGCPEDMPARDGAFIATRPLPRVSYFLARAWVVLVMLVLPLLLQETLYLIFSHRPWMEVLGGALRTGVQEAGLLLLAVPAAALWRGWLQTLAGGALLLSGCWFSSVVLLMAQGADPWQAAASNGQPARDGQLAALWTTLLVWCTLAWWQQRREAAFPRQLLRVAATSPLTALAFAAWTHLAHGNHQTPDLARTVQVSVPQARLSLELNATYQGRPARAFCGRIETTPLPPRIEMVHTLTSLQASQDGRPLPAHRTSDDGRQGWLRGGAGTSHGFPGQRTPPKFPYAPVASMLPAGTLLIPQDKSTQARVAFFREDPLEHELGRVETQHLDLQGGPLQVQGVFEAEWYEWRHLADLPLTPGAHASSAAVELTIVKAAPRESSPDNLTLFCRVHRRSATAFPMADLFLVLHDPEQRLAWCLGNELFHILSRGLHTHWPRLILQVHLAGVKGLPPADPSRLRLIVLQRRHIGSSTWNWQPEPMAARPQLPGQSVRYAQEGSLTPPGAEAQALIRRLDSLRAPGPQAGKTEMNRYVLDVLRAFHAIQTPATVDSLGKLVEDRLRPLAREHLDVLLALPVGLVGTSMSNPVFILARELATEAHRDYAVDHMAERDWLAGLVMAKGWSDYARQRALPALLQTQHHERFLTDLMLQWDDPALRQRQLDGLRFSPDASTFHKLYETPALRPQLDALARQFAAAIPPVKSWESAASDALDIAIRQGDAAALELGLRWASLGKVEGLYQNDAISRQIVERAARAVGLAVPPEGEPLPPGLSAAQFEYQPELRQWRKKP